MKYYCVLCIVLGYLIPLPCRLSPISAAVQHTCVWYNVGLALYCGLYDDEDDNRFSISKMNCLLMILLSSECK